MSGVAAAIRFDGGPAPIHDLRALIDAVPHRAPDGVGSWSGGGAALAKLHRLVLPGQHASAQPCVERDSSLVLVFDGRLDNRDELSVRYSIRPEGTDDAAYVAPALGRDWDRAIEMLEGDFALIAWNPRTRTAIAARDSLGNRPLHWTVRGSTVLLASDVAQLLAALPSTPLPDESAVSDVLSFEPPSDSRTVYRGVSRVPPGHVLIADERGVRLREYWRPEPRPADEGRSDEDYVEECRALLRRAVVARMRAVTPVLVFFSGGIDSSSVLATAVEVARAGGVPPPHPTTMVFDNPESDERCYRHAFFEKQPLQPVEVLPGPMDGRAYRAQAATRRVLPDMPSEFVGRPLFAKAKALGARVGMTGGGGDFLFSGSTHHYADLLSRGSVAAAVRRYLRDWKTNDSGWAVDGLITNGLWPLLPQPVRTVLRRPARRLMRIPDAPSWVKLPRPGRAAIPDPPSGVSHASWEICWSLRSGWTGVFIESGERGASEDGVEPRHPLWDPALIAFALGLPERLRRRDGTPKFVLRRAANLPDAIEHRHTKADFGHLIEQAFVVLGGRPFFEHLALAEAGWVDTDAAARAYDLTLTHSAVTDVRSAALLPRLWMLTAVELWYRAVYS
ncbi:MAG TPA: asparagine synthase-related protein [Vicinamibacterales bacterium]